MKDAGAGDVLPASPAARSTPSRGGPPLLAAGSLLLVALGGLAVMAALVWHSWLGMNPATGVYAALADASAHGAHPGGDDGRHLLATYYFPPYPWLVALLRGCGLEWLHALRVAAALGALAVTAAAATVAWRLRGGVTGSLVAAAVCASTYPVHDAFLASRADPLAATFALAALAAWLGDREQRRPWSGLLAAASLLFKATSVTAVVAVALASVAGRQWSAARRFAGWFVAALAAGVLLMIPIGGPAWYAAVWRALVGAPPCTFHPLRGAAELLRYAGAFPDLLVPFALLATLVLQRRGSRERAVVAFALPSLAITLYVMSNFAAGQNHLVELAALGAAVFGAWAGRRKRAALPLALAALLVAGATARDVGSALRHANAAENRREGILAAIRQQRGDVLTRTRC